MSLDVRVHGRVVCGPSSGISSGSSGDRRASCAARSTVRFSDASSSTFVDADARRLPIVTVTVTDDVGDAARRRDARVGEARVAAPARW